MKDSISRAAIAAALISMIPAAGAEPLTLYSPNGRVELRIGVGSSGQLEYSVSLQGKPVIETSPLGVTVDGVSLGKGARVGKAARYRVDESYPWFGAYSIAVNRANGARLTVTHPESGSVYTVEARVYDDGVAFRHVIPGGAKARVPDEATAFRLPAGSVVWFHDFEGHYEGVHVRKKIEEVKAGEWAAPPVTFKLPGGGYGSITEGGLRHYAGMGLQADGHGAFAARLGHAVPPSYPFRLRYKDDIERMAKPASITGTIITPWRIIMAAADLNGLVNCGIVNHVADPPDHKLFPQGARTPWIKPGRAVWKYLDGGENNLETVKEFSRLAGELGFEYQVVEGFWQKWSPEELRDAVEYSKKYGVRLWLWKHSNQLRTPESLRSFMKLCADAGAAGVKLDFYDHEAKEVVELYEDALRVAAEFRLMVNFHGSNKPTGEARTWPNELTREAVRGMESRKSLRAVHDATLPFTRLLAGPADYTPAHFGERRNDTTWAHQIATAVLFTSPLLTYAAHPKNLLANPAVDVIKSIPSVWDETRVLPGSEIGEVAGMARRKGNLWFVAIANGSVPRTFRFDLGFLGSGAYQATLVRDHADDPAAVTLEKSSFTSGGSITANLRAGGGFVARFQR